MDYYDSKEVKALIKRALEESNRELDNIPRHLLNEGNPNHPMYDNKIFGYDEKEFLAKQYKD